jgi:hypothetical protein
VRGVQECQGFIDSKIHGFTDSMIQGEGGPGGGAVKDSRIQKFKN